MDNLSAKTLAQIAANQKLSAITWPDVVQAILVLRGRVICIQHRNQQHEQRPVVPP